MADDNASKTNADQESSSGGGAATAVKERTKPSPVRKPSKPLPPWKVLLHNDDKNEFLFVIQTVLELTPLNEDDAIRRTTEAHKAGVALLLVTHKERAELYQDQFQSKGLTVSIEADE